jgi:hypothetical protein
MIIFLQNSYRLSLSNGSKLCCVRSETNIYVQRRLTPSSKGERYSCMKDERDRHGNLQNNGLSDTGKHWAWKYLYIVLFILFLIYFSCLCLTPQAQWRICTKCFSIIFCNLPTAYTERTKRNVPYFERTFLGLICIDLTKRTYIRSWTVTEAMTLLGTDLSRFHVHYLFKTMCCAHSAQVPSFSL